MSSPSLPTLPKQASDVPWPGDDWPTAEPGADVDRTRLDATLDRGFGPDADPGLGETLASVVVHRGQLVRERYVEGKGPEDTFISWSMAKSITHALVGILVSQGRLDPAAPAPVPDWQGEGDPRSAITLENLLRMCDGLDFTEVYEEDAGASDVIEMLFRSGKSDVAGFARSRGAAHAPGAWWNYSSGTSNIVSWIVGRAVGGGREGMEAFMRTSLFDPIGMRSATMRFDDAGTFIGSSFVFATARDFARFGHLYLRDGVWGAAETRILPDGWVDHARRPTPASSGWYGAHWWLALDDSGTFSANGYQGQYIVVVPSRDLILVRLGISTPEQRVEVLRWLRDLARSFPLAHV
ncbi:MAG: serine hydrolase domain-containing protein [Myxococcota bacterium]